MDYHAIQFTGSPCAGYNCAAASAAMGIFLGSGGRARLTADQVRTESGVSCRPGVRTPSGGLFIGDVIRVAHAHGVTIDYGRDPVSTYKRWSFAMAESRMASGWGMIVLGDYDQMPKPYRAVGIAFQGDHSSFAHDFRVDLHASYRGPVGPTVCFHDPLRPAPIRLPWAVFAAYWWKPTSPIRGYGGFVKDPRHA